MSDVTCPQCGTRNTDRVEFCFSCGAFLKWGHAPSTARDMDQQRPQVNPAVEDPGNAIPGPAAAPGQPLRAASSGAQGAPTPPSRRSPWAEDFSLWGDDPVPLGSSGPNTAPIPAAPIPIAQVPRSQPSTVQFTDIGTPPLTPTRRLPPVPAGSAWSDVVPQAPSETVTAAPPAGPGHCPVCGTTNAATTRFCKQCHHQLEPARPVALASTPVRRFSWWDRLMGADRMISPSMRRAWRRSLPVGYRIRRWLGTLLVVALAAGGLSLIGHNPARWLVNRWNDLSNNQVAVSGLTAATEPAALEVPGASADNAIDGKSDTAWAMSWPSNVATGVAELPCLPADTSGQNQVPRLLIGLPSELRVTAISVLGGLTTPDGRADQLRPKVLQIGYTGGCTNITLEDSKELQSFSMDFTAASLWVVVVDVVGAPATVPQVSISEIQVFARP